MPPFAVAPDHSAEYLGNTQLHKLSQNYSRPDKQLSKVHQNWKKGKSLPFTK